MESKFFTWFKSLNQQERKSIIAELFLMRECAQEKGLDWWVNFIDAIDADYHNLKNKN